MTTPDDIFALAEQVFGDKLRATRWLSVTHIALGDLTPIQMLSTHDGLERVRTALLRIEYGILA